MKRLLAEFLGTFALVFTGTGAIIVNDVSGGVIGHAGIALTFGLIVMAMIYSFGDVSGAHLNPVVTLSFAFAHRFPWRDVPAYAVAQVFGACAASGLLRVLFPTHATLGATLPAGSPAQSFVFELVLTALLMLVILSVSTGAKEKGMTAGIAVGGLIALEALFAGPICGASMNPPLPGACVDHWSRGLSLAIPCRAAGRRPAGNTSVHRRPRLCLLPRAVHPRRAPSNS